jgi:hypothetical protein
MLTSLRIRNFKKLDDVEIELGNSVVLIGPNNSGKTTALQALALWEIGLRKWLGRRTDKEAPKKRPGITINRRDLIAVPIPTANLLWRDLHTRATSRAEGTQKTQNIRIEIEVQGVSNGTPWRCGFEFDYANEESFYCRPLRIGEKGEERMEVAVEAARVRVAFLPPMSGLAATEDYLTEGAVDVRIGEGRTAEVLRNLCLQVSQPYQEDDSPSNWNHLTQQIHRLFGVHLNQPRFFQERGQITMSYRQGGVDLDLACAGRGLQQTLLLLAHIYTRPGSVLLLDEPDAHLEILRQRQMYHLLVETARRENCQIIAASHSEVMLEEAADRDILIAFVGKPHRIDDRGSQLVKSLKSIGFDQYYQAEITGWALYLEGSTDLAILRAFAQRLDHFAEQALETPFVHYIGNMPQKARDHFFGLREAKPDLQGIAIYDALGKDLYPSGELRQLQWQRREIENYLAFPETLLAYAQQTSNDEPPLFADSNREDRANAMQNAIEQVTNARRTLGQSSPFDPSAKSSDECLAPIFALYFKTLGLPNLMEKTDYHTLVPYVPQELIAAEIIEVLDKIVAVASAATPTT